MQTVLILREECVCAVLLILAVLFSRAFREAAERKAFQGVSAWALIHTLLEGVTVWTVNRPEQMIPALRFGLYAVFCLSAVLFSRALLLYTAQLSGFQPGGKTRWISLLPAVLYTALLPVLRRDPATQEGIRAAAGPLVSAGLAAACVCCFAALAFAIRAREEMQQPTRVLLAASALMLPAAGAVQLVFPGLFLSGGAVTLAVAGLLCALERKDEAEPDRSTLMDAMTGLETRNSYERDILKYDREYLENPGTQFIFLFADLNNLKSVNGMYGHTAGDEYISFIGRILREGLKEAEHIYRMGGDEFLAVYRNMPEETVIRGMEKVREACAQEARQKDYTPLLAMGYATSGSQYGSLHDVLRAADYMMYRNKADLKLERVQESGNSSTKLNLSGLTDRTFEAVCAGGDSVFLTLRNQHTGVTRISPKLADFLGLKEEFLADFQQIWMERLLPEDLPAYREALAAAEKEEKPLNCRCRVQDAGGRCTLVRCQGTLYHGRDGEPDYFCEYILPDSTSSGEAGEPGTAGTGCGKAETGV